MPKNPRPGAQPNPAIRLSNLGPRLLQLIANKADDPAALQAELTRLTDGLKPSSFLPIVVGVLAAPGTPREQVAAPTSAWLQQQGLLAPLHDLQNRHAFRDAEQDVARTLLEAGGITVAPEAVVELADLFLAAYELGAPSQDSPTLFWYEDVRRRRVRSAAFLVDFEPPWEGAIKDVANNTHRDFDRARDDFVSLWMSRGIRPLELDAATAAQRVWTALRQNQAQGIRLPADFRAALPQILPFLLALPVAPGVEPLTAADVEALSTMGRDPETIRREEQRLGYQTRMPDGSVIRIVRPPDDVF